MRESSASVYVIPFASLVSTSMNTCEGERPPKRSRIDTTIESAQENPTDHIGQAAKSADANADLDADAEVEVDSTPSTPSTASVDLERCTICLEPFFDRTILPVCAHEFCFTCILRWAGACSPTDPARSSSRLTTHRSTEQSCKCPLCARPFGDATDAADGDTLCRPYLIHHVRSKYDYQKYYLPPRPSSPPPGTSAQHRRRQRARRWGTRTQREVAVEDELEQALARRRWVYAHDLYAKVRPLSSTRPASRP